MAASSGPDPGRFIHGTVTDPDGGGDGGADVGDRAEDAGGDGRGVDRAAAQPAEDRVEQVDQPVQDRGFDQQDSS